jgi:hypothetical protein
MSRLNKLIKYKMSLDCSSFVYLNYGTRYFILDENEKTIILEIGGGCLRYYKPFFESIFSLFSIESEFHMNPIIYDWSYELFKTFYNHIDIHMIEPTFSERKNVTKELLIFLCPNKQINLNPRICELDYWMESKNKTMMVD